MASAFISLWDNTTNMDRLASPTTLRFALAEANHTVYTTPSSSNKTHHTPSMALPCEYGREQTKSVLIRFVTCEEKQSLTTMNLRTRPTGSHTV